MKYTDEDVDKLLDALEAKQAPQQVKLQPYTVLMIVPDTIAHQYGEDTYLAHINAENVEEAQQVAQAEAMEVLSGEEGIGDCVGTDFAVVFVCEGHMADIHIW